MTSRSSPIGRADNPRTTYGKPVSPRLCRGFFMASALRFNRIYKTRPRSNDFDRGLFISNVRLIATMRSRSKKGEVGRCCAQPCDRPEPIVIMVLPTDFNRSLICHRAAGDSYTATQNCIGLRWALLQSKLRRRVKRYTIILVHERWRSRNFVASFQKTKVANTMPRRAC